MIRSSLALVLVAALLASPVASAEPVSLEQGTEVGADRLVFGAEVGAAFIGLHGDVNASVAALGGQAQSVPLRSAAGILAGGFAELGLTENLALRVEGYWARERANADVSVGAGGSPFGGGPAVSIEYVRTAVEVPALAVWRFGYDGRFVPRLFAGPYLSIGIGGSVDGKADISDPEMMGNDIAFDTSADLGDDIQRTHFGVVVGGSMTFPVDFGHLVAQVRYHAGITTAVSAHEVQFMGGAATVSGEALRDRGLVLILGWQL